MAVEEFGAAIINDVGAPVNSPEVTVDSQKDMFRMVSRLRVPYIYMSRKSNIKDILLDSAEVVDVLRSMGQKDIIIDPGFGFGKTVEENYEVMNGLERLQMLKLPVLVALSRKSMIYRLLQSTQEEALTGTIALNTIALTKGASILRVHDVREAVECIKIVNKIACSSNLE
jgi:dihydropteroate synthase